MLIKLFQINLVQTFNLANRVLGQLATEGGAKPSPSFVYALGRNKHLISVLSPNIVFPVAVRKGAKLQRRPGRVRAAGCGGVDKIIIRVRA
nr:hypothetical protein [Cressdnaviricota sp.]